MTGRVLRLAGMSLVLAGSATGCLATHAPQARDAESAAVRFERLRDSLRLAAAGEVERDAPRIRLTMPSASWALTRYVSSSFTVSEDAYVLVVALDLDHRIRVLQPESPDESGFVAATGLHQLTRFHAGFGGPAAGYGAYEARYGDDRISPVSGGGVLVAVASARPLQLERLLGPGGDWDDVAIERLLFDRSLPSATHALAQAVVLTGQDYDVDFTTFSGRRTLAGYRTFASSGFGDCFAYGGWVDAFSSGYGTGTPRFLGVYSRNGQNFARYASGGDGCGRGVTYYDVPVGTYRVVPRTPADTARPGDSIPDTRPRHFPGAPRFPSVTAEGGSSFTPADGRRPEHDQPTIVAGLRIRPPDRLPPADERPIGPMTSDARGREVHVRFERPDNVGTGGGPGGVSGSHYEPLRHEPAQGAPARLEPARTEPARTEPPRVEPPRSEPPRVDPPRAEPVRSAPVTQSPAVVPR